MRRASPTWKKARSDRFQAVAVSRARSIIALDESTPIEKKFSFCQRIFNGISPTWVPTSSTMPLSTPSFSARSTKASSSFVGNSRVRESMNASRSSLENPIVVSMRLGCVNRDSMLKNRKFQNFRFLNAQRVSSSLWQGAVELFHEHVVLDHVLRIAIKRDDIVIERERGQGEMD